MGAGHHRSRPLPLVCLIDVRSENLDDITGSFLEGSLSMGNISGVDNSFTTASGCGATSHGQCCHRSSRLFRLILSITARSDFSASGWCPLPSQCKHHRRTSSSSASAFFLRRFLLADCAVIFIVVEFSLSVTFDSAAPPALGSAACSACIFQRPCRHADILWRKSTAS